MSRPYRRITPPNQIAATRAYREAFQIWLGTAHIVKGIVEPEMLKDSTYKLRERAWDNYRLARENWHRAYAAR